MKFLATFASLILSLSFAGNAFAFASLSAKSFYYAPGKDQMVAGQTSSIWVEVCNSGDDASEPTYLTLEISHHGSGENYNLNVPAIGPNECQYSDGMEYVFSTSGLWGVRAEGDDIMWTFEPIYIN